MYDRVIAHTTAAAGSSSLARSRGYVGRNAPTKIKYIIQSKGRPPTFLLFCNQPKVDKIPESFVRFLTKQFQDTFEMYGMPIRLIFKPSSKDNPFDRSSSPGMDGSNKPELRRGGKARRKYTYSSGVGGKEARMQRLYRNLQTTGKPAPKRYRRRKRKQTY